MKTNGRAPTLPRGHLPVVQPDKADVDEVRFPDIADLMARLHFSMSDGRIWLDDQRMLLVHAKALGSLRRELIEALGVDMARGFLTRMGYHAGARDAEMARKVRPKTSLKDMFVVGPQMHCLEGIGLSEPVRLEFDVERGTHYGEFIWTSAVEDEEHSRHFAIGTEPMCWMQIGYASGFSTEFMGRPVLYREVECQSMGQPACRIVGRTVEEWGDEAAHDLRFLQAETFSRGLSAQATGPADTAALPVALPARAPQEEDSLVGISPSFNSVCHMVRRVAPTQATVLFLGESGVGKEVFARTVHRLSPRGGKSFVALNCAAIPEQLIESELFGAERGAYTGAMQSRLGRFERADGGTLFLDEIGTLSASAQGKLLRALQEGEIERLGDSHTRRVDVRVIAATNVDLREEVRGGALSRGSVLPPQCVSDPHSAAARAPRGHPAIDEPLSGQANPPPWAHAHRLHPARHRRPAVLRLARQHPRNGERDRAWRHPRRGQPRHRRAASVHQRREAWRSALCTRPRRQAGGRATRRSLPRQWSRSAKSTECPGASATCCSARATTSTRSRWTTSRWCC